MKKNNFIEIYDALDKDTCKLVISKFEEASSMNRTKPGQTTGNTIKEVRNSEDYYYYREGETGSSYLSDKIFKVLWDNVAKYLNKYLLSDGMDFYSAWLKDNNKTEFDGNIIQRMMQKEKTKILIQKIKKNEGHSYAWHEDTGNAEERFLTAMFYLNDIEQGGETEFYHQELKIKPKEGKLVIFPPHFTHLHRGHIPLSDDKYIINFFLFRPGKWTGRML